MMEFRTFGSAEEMFKAIQRGVEQAKARATPEQNAITKGDYWWRYVATMDLHIFGYIMTDDELYSGSAYRGISEREIQWEKEAAKDSYDNGFRFGRAYSVVVPEGELGETHVADMVKISKAQFDYAKQHDWSLSTEYDDDDEIPRIIEFWSLA